MQIRLKYKPRFPILYVTWGLPVHILFYLLFCPPESSSKEPPTPHYNNAVLHDLALEQHFHHLSNCITDFPGMKDGISILKVWLRQRQLDKVSQFGINQP